MSDDEDRDVEEGDGEPFRLLFVCTGNTCRSPMAEVLARSALKQRGWREVEVRSSGVAAMPGLPASPGAVRAAERRDLSLRHHGSRPLDVGEVERADLILTMSPLHLEQVRELGGEGKGALITAFARGEEERSEELKGVVDPVGGGDEVYEEVCRELEELLEGVLARLEPVLKP